MCVCSDGRNYIHRKIGLGAVRGGMLAGWLAGDVVVDGGGRSPTPEMKLCYTRAMCVSEFVFTIHV